MDLRAKRQLGGQVLTAEDRLKKELFLQILTAPAVPRKRRPFAGNR